MTALKFGQGFRALRHPNYRLYWCGQCVSLVGTWMQTVAQSWLVLQITGSSVDLGIVAALQSLPVFVLSPFGGLVADRFSKRNLLIATQSTQALLALVLGVLVNTHLVQVWQIYLLAGLLGVTNGLDMPTRQSFMIEMVGRDDLLNAVALQSMQFNAARIVGPALAGLAIAAIGIVGSFYANAFSFLAVILGLLAMRVDHFYEMPQFERTSVAQSLREGWRYVWQTPAVLMIVTLVSVIGLFNSNVNIIVPLFAKNILRVGPQGYGLLMAMMGIGAVAGSMLAAFGHRSRWTTILAGALGFFLFQIGFGLSRFFPLSLVLMVLSGFSLVSFFTAANTSIQQRIPDQLRGRVMGVYMSVNVGTAPFGNLAIGWLAAEIGAPTATVLSSITGLAVLLIMGGWMATHRAAIRLGRPHATPIDEPERAVEAVDAGD